GELLKKIAPGRIIVVIEHDMEFVRQYADFVTVLHAGRLLAEGSISEIQANTQVQEVYLGRNASEEVA
ncbi:MAG TPA: ABC transporter ATP-binding protein, partial [Nocardioides bacterium]|nr:ABC transporter ATP-binding protein [Nocardioides sp.]